MASRQLNEQGHAPDIIELQLAHRDSSVRAIYNRSTRLPERRAMMQSWSDYVDALRAGSHVVPFRRAVPTRSIARPERLIAQYAHQGMALCSREPLEAECLGGEILMRIQCPAAPIPRPQRGEVRGNDVESLAQVLPERRRHHPRRFPAHSSGHRQETARQRHSDLERGSVRYRTD